MTPSDVRRALQAFPRRVPRNHTMPQATGQARGKAELSSQGATRPRVLETATGPLKYHDKKRLPGGIYKVAATHVNALPMRADCSLQSYDIDFFRAPPIPRKRVK